MPPTPLRAKRGGWCARSARPSSRRCRGAHGQAEGEAPRLLTRAFAARRSPSAVKVGGLRVLRPGRAILTRRAAAGSRTEAAGRARPPRRRLRRGPARAPSPRDASRSMLARARAGPAGRGRRSRAARRRAPGGCRAHAGDRSEYGLFDTSTTARSRCWRPWSSTSPGRLPARSGRAPAPPSEQRSRLGISVGRLLNRVAVDPQRDVVEEQAAVHLGHVDPALDAVGERVERSRPGRARSTPTSSAKWLRVPAGTQTNGSPCAAAAAATTASDPSPPAMPSASAPAATASSASAARLSRGEDDRLDPLLSRPLGDARRALPCRHPTSG